MVRRIPATRDLESDIAMRTFCVLILGLMPFTFAATASAVETENFVVDTAGDLAALCSAASGDPLQQQALHFCHGFVVGAYHYHLKSTGGPEGSGFVCLPDPAPSRDEVIGEFVVWLGNHPEQKNEDAVDAFFEWATARFPCQ
jgi:hypothetical protein